MVRSNCSDSRGNEGLKVENRERIPLAYAQVDGCQTAFDQFEPPSLNSYGAHHSLFLTGPPAIYPRRNLPEGAIAAPRWPFLAIARRNQQSSHHTSLVY